MLKRYWPTIPLAIFFALAVYFEWSSASAPRPINQTAGNQQADNRSVDNNSSAFFTIGTWASSNHDAIEALAAIISVIFTVVLVGANISLWRVTRTAANAAKEAADAASVSAKAVAVVERAYVYPIIIAHGAINDCIQSAFAWANDGTPSPVTTELTYRFKNFGKTPAVLKSAFVGFGAAPLGALIGVSIPESVLAYSEETHTLVSQMWVGVTCNQAQHILAYTGHFCFDGTVTFDDIWGNEHTTEFYFVWDKEINRMTLRSVETKTTQKGEQPQSDA